MSRLKDNIEDYISRLTVKPKKTSVAATDYTASAGGAAGMPVTAGWRDGHVSVGGILVEPERVTDGKAIVSSSAVDGAIGTLKSATGVQSNAEVGESYDGYRDLYDKKLSEVAKREDFTYEPEEDDVYKSYKKQYNREGERATENTMGQYSALTGGMANSSAVTAAAQAGQYWNDKLTDVIPLLAENAYERYIKEFDMDRQALADILTADSTSYERAYSANRDTVSDIREADRAAYERDKDIGEANARKEQWQSELELDRQKAQEQSRQNGWDNAYKLMQSTGGISSEAIATVLGLPVGTVTADMKKQFENLASEINSIKQKYENEKELEQIKHENTMDEIEAKKK